MSTRKLRTNKKRDGRIIDVDPQIVRWRKARKAKGIKLGHHTEKQKEDQAKAVKRRHASLDPTKIKFF